MAHNGPLFWLDVVERSLVKYVSSAAMSHPVNSILLIFFFCYLPCVRIVRPLTLFLRLVAFLNHLPFASLRVFSSLVEVSR